MTRSSHHTWAVTARNRLIPCIAGSGVAHDADGALAARLDRDLASFHHGIGDFATAAGSAGGSEDTVYFEDFEGTTSVTRSSGSADWWHASSGCLGGNTGRSLQHNRADTKCIYGSGTSRVTGWSRTVVDLTAASSAALAFEHKWETESFSGGAYDIISIQASNETTGWTTLKQYDSRDANQLSWKAETFDLAPWVGDSTVYVRFYFDSVDGTANGYKGWAVDDFQVTKG